MKKLLVTLISLTLLFLVSCAKVEIPQDLPENKEEAPLTPIEQVMEYIDNEEFEKAYELLLTLEGEEAEKLLLRFSLLPEKHIETDRNGNTTTTDYVYDKWGNVTEKTVLEHWGQKRVEKNEYDERGRLLSRTQISPKDVSKTVYTYNDNDDILTIEQYTNGALSHKQENVYNENGGLLSVKSNSSEHIYEYNNKGLLISQNSTYHYNGTSLKNEYEYDEQDRLSKHIFTDEYKKVTVREFTYTDEGKIETETEDGKVYAVKVFDKKDRTVYEIYPSNKTGLLRTEYEYAENGKMNRRYMVTLNDGKEEWQETVWESADANNLLKIPANSPLKETTTTSSGDVHEDIYTYDENGELSRIVTKRNGEVVLTQIYTVGEKLINEVANDHDYKYTYHNGNLLEMKDEKSSYSLKYENYKLYYNPNK